MVGAGGFEPPDGRSKVSWLTTCRRPNASLGARDLEGRLLEPLLFVLHENPILDELPSLVVDGMRYVLVRAIGALPTRHGDEHAVRSLDDLQPPNDERIVEGHARERLQLVIVPQGNTDLGDFERHTFTASSSGPRSLEVPGIHRWIRPIAPPEPQRLEPAIPAMSTLPARRLVRWYARRGRSRPGRLQTVPPIAPRPSSVRARKPWNHYRTQAIPERGFGRARV